MTSLISLSMVTKRTPPSCRASYVWYVKQNRRSKYINTLMSRRTNRLVGLLLDSEHRLQTLQQLRITVMSLTICCPTTWSRQHWL